MIARRASRHGGVAGFTLIELIVTIAIVAILAAIALPNFGTSMRNSRVTSQANDLVTAINLARSEAITRSRGVSICAADTRAGTPSACGGASDWDKGWLVFLDDVAGTTAPATVASANVLRSWIATPKTTIELAPDQNFLRFSARGESVTGAAIISLVPSDACTGQEQRLIAVNTMGRASAQRTDCP